MTPSMPIDDEQEENSDSKTTSDGNDDLRVLKVINNNKTKQLSLHQFFKNWVFVVQEFIYRLYFVFSLSIW